MRAASLKADDPIRLAIDFLGGDRAPASVADAIAEILDEGGPARLVVVGPREQVFAELSSRGVDPARVDHAEASHAADMGADALPSLREHDDLTASVAVGLIRSGQADGWVSVGHSGAAVAATALALGRLPGMPLPALAVVLPALAGPVVLVDSGATLDAGPETLVTFALAGWAYAASLGLERPRVGLLTIGSEAGKGDRLRKNAHDLLTSALDHAGVDYVGPVEGHDVALGSRADVVVCDGFTGNVLLKGIEGTVRWSAARMGEAYGSPTAALDVVTRVATSDFAGGLLLGVPGVAVIGHGASTGPEIAACIRLAERAVRTGVVGRAQEVLATRLSQVGVG